AAMAQGGPVLLGFKTVSFPLRMVHARGFTFVQGYDASTQPHSATRLDPTWATSWVSGGHRTRRTPVLPAVTLCALRASRRGSEAKGYQKLDQETRSISTSLSSQRSCVNMECAGNCQR